MIGEQLEWKFISFRIFCLSEGQFLGLMLNVDRDGATILIPK